MLSTLLALPAMLKLIITALIFVVSNGTLFTKRFREHTVLKAIVSLIAVISTLLLGDQLVTMLTPKVTPTTITTQVVEISKHEDYEPEMVHIAKGSFTMGSYDGGSDEKPPHRVNIDYNFEIGKYEVTIGQYKRFIEETESNYPLWLEEGNKYNIYSGSDEYYKEMCLEDDCPVMGVSWNNAKAYVKWLSEKTGKAYRLPSEAEWEYVARAGSRSKWSFGDDESTLEDYAWYSKNSDNKTHRVGTKKANTFGVYDMHGNVWEWCEDWYVDSYKHTLKDGKANEEGEKKYRVFRGGSWDYNSNSTRSANRFWDNPTNRVNYVGFRLLRTLP